MELSLMASRGCPPGLAVCFHQEQVSGRVSEGFDHVIPYHGSNQDFVNPLSFRLSLRQKEEWRSSGGFLDNNHFIRIDSPSKRPELIDFKTDTRPGLVHLSFGIVEQCTMHEKMLKLLTSGSIEEESDLLDLSMLFNDPQSLNFLIYPNKELYFNKSFLDLVGDNCTGSEMKDIVSVISDFHSSRNTNKSSKQTMLVPYFERRRRAHAKTDASKLATEKVRSHKSNNKVKEKTSQKKKTGKERDVHSNSSLRACEALLSIIADRKQQNKATIAYLKKSGPQLPHLLTQLSATIAGTGIAVVLSIICRVACSRVPFCASKLTSTGLGLGLVWLSWAVNKLRDTVISIRKTSGTFGEKEEEMMNHLGRNLKDVYFRAAALMVVAVLKVA